MKLPILEDEFKEAREARTAWVFVMSASAFVAVFFGAVTLESGGRPVLLASFSGVAMLAFGAVQHWRCLRIVSAWRDIERAKLAPQPDTPHVGGYRDSAKVRP